jgi:hypothetical protein
LYYCWSATEQQYITRCTNNSLHKRTQLSLLMWQWHTGGEGEAYLHSFLS